MGNKPGHEEIHVHESDFEPRNFAPFDLFNCTDEEFMWKLKQINSNACLDEYSMTLIGHGDNEAESLQYMKCMVGHLCPKTQAKLDGLHGDELRHVLDYDVEVSRCIAELNRHGENIGTHGDTHLKKYHDIVMDKKVRSSDEAVLYDPNAKPSTVARKISQLREQFCRLESDKLDLCLKTQQTNPNLSEQDINDYCDIEHMKMFYCMKSVLLSGPLRTCVRMHQKEDSDLFAEEAFQNCLEIDPEIQEMFDHLTKKAALAEEIAARKAAAQAAAQEASRRH
eukprot:GEZU01005238.1.p1 GENE.GEZU01005238.1~~GEZU01005238.1.p1  ORF type:complete len:281 (-),score=85.09 GEZU01005238.1:716-1558(-)